MKERKTELNHDEAEAPLVLLDLGQKLEKSGSTVGENKKKQYNPRYSKNYVGCNIRYFFIVDFQIDERSVPHQG